MDAALCLCADGGPAQVTSLGPIGRKSQCRVASARRSQPSGPARRLSLLCSVRDRDVGLPAKKGAEMRTSGNAARSPPAPEPQTGSPARRPPDGEEERVAVTSTGPSPGSGSPRPAGATADPRPGGGGGGRAGSGRRPGAAPNSVSRWALWHSRGRDVDLGRLPRRCWALEAASRRQVEPILPRGNSSARRGPEARAHRAPTRGGQARFFTSNNPALPRGRKGHREAKLPLRGHTAGDGGWTWRLGKAGGRGVASSCPCTEGGEEGPGGPAGFFPGREGRGPGWAE